MKECERLVYAYLEHMGLGPVVYEPDGQVSPDFLVDGRIAVETRRLNRREKGGPARGLECTAISLRKAVRKALLRAGPPDESGSWYVRYRVRRPLPAWREVEKLLDQAVERACAQLPSPPNEADLGWISLRFLPSGRVYDSKLVLGGNTDCDSTGFIVPDLLSNLRLSIEEKVRKISPYRQKYAEWWLAFEDRISYGDLDRADLELLRSELGDCGGFARVLLINPLHPTCALDLVAQ